MHGVHCVNHWTNLAVKVLNLLHVIAKIENLLHLLHKVNKAPPWAYHNVRDHVEQGFKKHTEYQEMVA